MQSIFKFKKFEEKDGTLVPLELYDIWFIPKRIFWIYNVPIGTTRGNHAHYKTKQLLICQKGKISVNLYDGFNKYSYILNSGEGLYIDKLIWDSQTFLTNDDILLVLANSNYNINDYIIDINEFEKIVKQKYVN